MGFWHTGYEEFHEPTGFGEWMGPDLTIRFDCDRCSASFDTLEALRKHRFVAHPLQQPRAFFKGFELGAQTVRIRSAFQTQDFEFAMTDELMVNGRRMSLPRGLSHLASLGDEFVNLELVGADMTVSHKVDIRIARNDDLKAVEAALLRMSGLRRLTVETIETFIRDCEAFESAKDYVQGITRYLYGVMAKERAPSSSLRFDDYPSYFNEAEQTLEGFDRPAAQLIRALVAFHFNRFADSRRFAPTRRLRTAAGAFESLLRASDRDFGVFCTPFSSKTDSTIEVLLTDEQTESILGWLSAGLSGMAVGFRELEAALVSPWAEYDRLKIKLILAVSCLHNDNSSRVRQIARELIGLPETEKWAEGLLSRLKAKEEKND
jgi:hypothetical protein